MGRPMPEVSCNLLLPYCQPVLCSLPERADRVWLGCQTHGVRLTSFHLGKYPERFNFRRLPEAMKPHWDRHCQTQT